jgi:hypothetical protein
MIYKNDCTKYFELHFYTFQGGTVAEMELRLAAGAIAL